MVTLTLLTFLVGALADYVIRQRKRKNGAVTNDTALTTAAIVPVEAEFSPAYVEGFLVLEGLRYHSGHTWVQREQLNTARVGMDEFGAKLAWAYRQHSSCQSLANGSGRGNRCLSFTGTAKRPRYSVQSRGKSSR